MVVFHFGSLFRVGRRHGFVRTALAARLASRLQSAFQIILPDIDTGDKTRMLNRVLLAQPCQTRVGATMSSMKEGDLSKANDIGSSRQGLAESDDAISRALVGARTTATPLSAFPGPMPGTMAQAYAIQSASIARWPDSVAGWKIGLLSPQDQGRYSAERLAGPVFHSQIHEVTTGSSFAMPIFVGGFAAVEAEFIFRLGETVEPVDREWSDDELAELAVALHIGAEIASSPMAEINNLGPTVVTADFGNNAGLLLGPEIPNWRTVGPENLPARVTIDGEIVGEASAAAIPGGPIGALRFLVALAAHRGLELPAGTLVSTGASTGIHDVDTTSISRLEFGEFGYFEVTFEPMSGTQ